MPLNREDIRLSFRVCLLFSYRTLLSHLEQRFFLREAWWCSGFITFCKNINHTISENNPKIISNNFLMKKCDRSLKFIKLIWWKLRARRKLSWKRRTDGWICEMNYYGVCVCAWIDKNSQCFECEPSAGYMIPSYSSISFDPYPLLKGGADKGRILSPFKLALINFPTFSKHRRTLY